MPDTRTHASGTRETLRLTGLLLAIALATSRLGILAHELAGHGGMAVAVGGEVTEVQLFWFAGGWIRYHFATPPSIAAQLAISMAGIAVEAFAGTALCLALRGDGDGLGRRLVRGIGAALVLHASWYLATGAWQGFGDGQLLHQVLGSARYPVAIGAGAITCGCGFLGARSLVGTLRATGSSLVGLTVAAVLAGGIHAALAVGEIHVRRDTTYATIMRPEHERQVDHELARWAAYEAAHGGEVTPAEREREHARLEQAHRTFPFAWVLGACAVLAMLAGAWRSLQRTQPAVTLGPALLVRAVATAAIAIATVIAIDRVAR
ncbi:hypothetical protein BH11MYX1_BH11MYX1_14230 [soil metagenome]